jgi:16S rRNA G966 N2-methylase RsmD
VATWFIDPPYEGAGKHYIHNSKDINYSHLADWCKSRAGQVIVCEDQKATWLEFKPMISQHGREKWSYEAIWSNEKTVFDNKQLTLF